MFDELKKRLYLTKLHLLFEKGFNDGRIVPFDDDFYKSMSTTYFGSIPVSINIRYLKPKRPPGKCYDRSLMMFFCFDDAVLVRGDNKDLEVQFGKEKAERGWIEIGNYVYDPTLLLRFDKDLYYKMYEIKKVNKCNRDEYCAIGDNKKFYDEIRETSLEDYLPNGKRRTELLMTIPLVRSIAEKDDNPNFIKEVDEWLKRIDYDEEQIYNEMNRQMELLKIPIK